MSAPGQLCGMSRGALIVYNHLINKKQQGHLSWLLSDHYLAPWTLLCFHFTLALVFIGSVKNQTLTTGTGHQLWLTCHILYSVVLINPPSERTELLCFSKSLAFPFMCLITHILLCFWPTNHSWLLQFGKCNLLSWLLVFRALLYIWHGNCFILQQAETSISANCHSRSCLKLDRSEIILMIKR